MHINILDYESAVSKLDGAVAALHFLGEGLDSQYYEGKALAFIQEQMAEAMDEVKELFETALELSKKIKEIDER